MPTGIPYAERNWETTGGCTKIAAGCFNCYAIPLIGNRFANNPLHKGRYTGLVKDGNWTGKIKLFEDRLDQPLRRGIPTTYFVNSRSDTFHEAVPFEFINKMWGVMMKATQHTYLIFTKRYRRAQAFMDQLPGRDCYEKTTWIKDIHLFFSASTQKEVDEAVPILLQIPAARRGLSLEPLLGNINLGLQDIGQGLHCIIVGSESGSKRRSCTTESIRHIVEQCKWFNLPVYVKQMEIDGKVVTDPKLFPPDLQVREGMI